MLARVKASDPEDDPMPQLRLVDPESPARLRIAAHLSKGEPGTSGGTFVATGLVADSGVLPDLDRFGGLRDRPRAPLVVQGAESFAGAAGRIAIAYDGIFRLAGPGVYSGQGAWRVTGGDHAYKRLRGQGSWTATAVVADGVLTVDAVYEGTGLLR
jgi:hypothetical protein